MRDGDIKDQILHSMGTLVAFDLVMKKRIEVYDNPTASQVLNVFTNTMKEFEKGLMKQIKNSS